MTEAKHTNKPPSNPHHRPPKTKPRNPIELAIQSWHSSLPPELHTTLLSSLPTAISSAPKRWAIYPPMALLPSGNFTDEWWAQFSSPIASEHKHSLWEKILFEIGKREGKGAITHLAVNAGIPLQRTTISSDDGAGTAQPENESNILRTPSGLIMLYGDFGPALELSHIPTEQDFAQAFWVSTRQNGITQVWAPRYTMFSRGNVKEKARLLEFHGAGCEVEERRLGREELGKGVAVDLYAGIGYFVFSYVKMGMGCVVGWELNAWSVEGLRRGAKENGWSVRVVRENEVIDELGDSQIVVFLEDNQRAVERLRGVVELNLSRVMHVNCGLLPTSEGSWRTAVALLKGSGWLHLHENVGAKDVEQRKGAIEDIFRGWLKEDQDDRQAILEHVEYVKTFAPDVWHCVFDLYISEHRI